MSGLVPFVGLQLPYGLQPVNPTPVDAWSGPYIGADSQTAVALANAAIPSGVRFQSMEIRLIVGGISKKFWYRDGTADSDLTEFQSGAGGLSFSSELVMNGLIVGEKDGANKSFSLPDLPTDPTSFMLWLNGQLLTQGSDYSISSLNLTFLGSLAPASTDIIRSMYSRRVISKSYALSERPIQTFSSGSILTGIKLANIPDPADSLMLFLNGQLLTQGSEHDYDLQDEIVTFNKSLITDDIILTTYCYGI
jgi:hypothetical protein